ncbi:MAG: NAD(P)H-hydrate epimerase, partial [Coriobacteriales bacterium]
MRYALTAAQIRKAEALATASGKVTMAELMQRAGSALAAEVMGRVPSGTVAVVCGKGNNGGDGWVAARILLESGRDVRVVSLVDPATLTGLAAEVASAAIAEGVAWEHLEERSQILERLERVAVTVDAVFGVGFSGAPRGVFALAIAAIEAASTPVVSADVPSGVDADTGRAPGPAVHADVTVTFSAHKIGLVQYPGAAYAGEVAVADVGLDLGPTVEPGACEVWEQDDYARVMPLPEPDAHKGTRGRVLLVAGSRQYAGAAVLAAAGAMRMGAGYAIAAVPECVIPAVQASLPHVIAASLPQTSNGSLAREAEVRIRELASEADAVVIGPGLTTFAETSALVRDLVATLTAPLLID